MKKLLTAVLAYFCLFGAVCSLPKIAEATVSSTTSKNVYNGDGTTILWGYTFPIILSTDIQVYTVDSSNVQTQILTNYSINTSTKQVTYPVVGSPIAVGTQIVLLRSEPLTQSTSLKNQYRLPLDVIETSLDKVTMMVQQLQEQVSRSFQAPVNQTTPGTDLISQINTAVSSSAASASAASSSASSAATSASQAVAALAGTQNFWGGSVGGTGNAITLTPSPVITSYSAGQTFTFLASANNTTAVTVAISGLSAKGVKTQSGAALSSGEIVSGKLFTMTYDGTNFIVKELATPEDGVITNAKVNSSAAIAYSKLNVASSITRTDIASGYGLVPQGAILMWSGSIATIPTGWELSDGTCAITCPDLRNRFIVAADADVSSVAKSTVTGSAAQTGGSTTIAQGNLPSYNLSFTRYDGNGSSLTGVQGTTNGANAVTQNVASAGSGTAYTQPFYALAYIIKD